MSGQTDPVAAADALVAAIEPGLSSPGVESREVVLVTGPWLAGTSTLTAALRERMPDHTFVEPDGLAPADAPAAVVFVVSAITPLTESDCALADLATNYTDLVIGCVSKIDTHRNWREVMAADRALLAERAPRYRHVPWVGAAAAPDIGEAQLDELLGLLTERLADTDRRRRNRLRAWETRLESLIGRYRADGAGTDRDARVTALRKRREDIRRGRRLSRSERSIALRSQIQQARVQLAYFARNRCTSVRAELQEDVGGMSRRRLGGFEAEVRRRAADVVNEVDEGTTKHVGDVATELGLIRPRAPSERPTVPDFPAPPLRARGLETRLIMVLGAGFGLGVALAVSRLFAGISPGLTIAGVVAGGVGGLAVTVWVTGVRGLLHDRAVMDRWVTEVTTTLRSSVEELTATRVLAAEAELTADLGERDEAESATAADRIAEIDVQLREHAVATARAAALRDRRLPPLQAALTVVRRELYGSAEQSAAEVAPVNGTGHPTDGAQLQPDGEKLGN